MTSQGIGYLVMLIDFRRQNKTTPPESVYYKSLTDPHRGNVVVGIEKKNGTLFLNEVAYPM